MMEEYQDQSLRGKVFQKIREEILSGVYQDGEELREVTLGEKLGVSRTPVREALRQLELEGCLLYTSCWNWRRKHSAPEELPVIRLWMKYRKNCRKLMLFRIQLR